MSRLASVTLAALLAIACGPMAQIPKPEEEAVQAAPSSGEAADVLAGHLVVDLPSGAIDAPRRASIMAAPQSSTDETRIVLEGGGPEGMAKFVMMVTELYLLGSGDLKADADKLAAKGEKVSELRGARLPTFTLEPTTEPLPDRPLFVLGGIVAHPDGTLQEVEFFILPEMAASKEDYADRARSVLSTFAPGKRKIATGGGKTPLGKALFVDVPPSFLVSTQPGPDFDVFRVRRLRRPGEPGATLGIYVGGHPSLQIDQLMKSGDDPPPAKTEEGTLLGRKTEWVQWRGADGLEIKEAIVSLDDHQSVHIFAMATTVEDLEGLMRIVQTLSRAH